MGRKSDNPLARTFVQPNGGLIAEMIAPKGGGQWRVALRSSQSQINDGQLKIVLDQMMRHGQAATAAEAAGISLARLKKVIKEDEEFAGAFEHVQQLYADQIVFHVQDLAHNGVIEEKFSPDTGERISLTTRYDSKLIVKELERRDKSYTPQKKVDVDVSGSVGVLAIPNPSQSLEEYEKKHGKIIDVKAEVVADEAEEPPVPTVIPEQ